MDLCIDMHRVKWIWSYSRSDHAVGLVAKFASQIRLPIIK